MYRQSFFARLHSSFGQQRKLFLLVFLWTCLCLVIFKSSLFNSATPKRRHQDAQATKIYARAVPTWPASTHSSLVPVTANNEFKPGSQCKYDYPSLFDLQFNNIHWQKLTILSSERAKKNNSTTSSTYYLYNAYYDDRWRGGLPSIRILAMIDRIEPPATNCLLWSSRLSQASQDEPNQHQLVPLLTRASFVYAWYPKWGNYKDGLLQPWIVTCPIPRKHVGLVPDSVSLVPVPAELETQSEQSDLRNKRNVNVETQQPASMAMPASFSSSSPSISPSSRLMSTGSSGGSTSTGHGLTSSSTFDASPSSNDIPQSTHPMQSPIQYDCKQTQPITNNLPVYNQRPSVKGKFAVCVKGLDFPHEDVSVRLIEWIEMLNLLGAGKIFLYNLDVHENISKVLHYYQKRGIVELSPLTLPGDQPNLPEYQHLYLKNRLTAKRQNELIPYNDCLYRNLNSYQYLALLDIDEIIMPLREHHSWFDLMQEVERLSLGEQNYSRASYNVRNVYFFDDLTGPMGTTWPSSGGADSSQEEGRRQEEEETKSASSDSMERGIPHYLHMMQHVYRSKNYTKPGQYVKCFHNTERVVSLHNHFPMNCFGQCTTYSIPVELAHLQHYRKDCVGPLKQSCKNDYRAFTTRDTTIWKYKQQMIRRTTRVLSHLGLLSSSSSSSLPSTSIT